MSDEQREIIETIRDRRDRAVDAHGRTAAAMDVMHLSPFEQAVYVDESLNTIDRLTAERDVAYAELSRVRYAIDRLTAERDAARSEVERLRAGIMELKRVNDKNIEWCRNQLPRPTAMEVDEVEAILRTHEWFGSCIRATLETGDTDVR